MSSTLAAARPCSTNTASAARRSSIVALRSAGRGIVDSPVNYMRTSGPVKPVPAGTSAAYGLRRLAEEDLLRLLAHRRRRAQLLAHVDAARDGRASNAGRSWSEPPGASMGDRPARG